MSTYEQIDTLVRYKDLSGRERTKVTNKFGPETQFTDVQQWTISWWKGVRTFEIEIKDRYASRSFVEQTNSDTVQMVCQNCFSSLCTSDLIVINPNKAGMKFTKDVSDIQRDQYETDETKSSDNIGDIEIKDGNNIFIEQIPVQLYKRKRNLNQSQTVNIRPRKGKKVPQTMEHTEVSNSKVNQHQQTQLMHVSSEHQTSLSMPTTEQLQQSAYVPISQCYLLTPVHSMTTGFLDAQVSFFDESSFSVKN
ncbi:unnamed protein product [Rotaria sp. Silwood1]|nr:unnamed protein product [Rotaria sp. Silwood1]CAF1636379.1 unnamed protein product [Rotaria sp. Silwood1]CAF3737403.1 unnamed protein product [Rotaria sp. Silwood1]CAF3768393.1 unnamed protein product [Rotaria sp. Silwood1]CAF3829071.1 unnamed protein product [Rotaria sp. Silwood1]